MTGRHLEPLLKRSVQKSSNDYNVKSFPMHKNDVRFISNFQHSKHLKPDWAFRRIKKAHRVGIIWFHCYQSLTQSRHDQLTLNDKICKALEQHKATLWWHNCRTNSQNTANSGGHNLQHCMLHPSQTHCGKLLMTKLATHDTVVSRWHSLQHPYVKKPGDAISKKPWQHPSRQTLDDTICSTFTQQSVLITHCYCCCSSNLTSGSQKWYQFLLFWEHICNTLL